MNETGGSHGSREFHFLRKVFTLHLWGVHKGGPGGETRSVTFLERVSPADCGKGAERGRLRKLEISNVFMLCEMSVSPSVMSDSLSPHGLKSLLGSSVHGVLQARILEWEAIAFSKGVFPTQGLNPGLLHADGFFTI